MDHDDRSTNPGTPGGQPPEPVEDRPNVGTVTPEDYPVEDRAGAIKDPPLDENQEYERLNPGSGGSTPDVPGAPKDRDNA